MPKVTVYIPNHNYGKYIERAVESILTQTMADWELLVIDDGSTDDSLERLKQYDGDVRIKVVSQQNKGLNVTNNLAIRLARGQYIIRLDADDYVDENILIVLSNILDTRPDVGLVFPDYYVVDNDGRIIEIVRKENIEKSKLMDIPPHGACTMFRRSILTNVGSYSETFTCQDGYDIWLKFVNKYKPYNVNIPLFYYRQHPSSLSKNSKKILETRRRISRQYSD